MAKPIFVLNGPNLNLLGEREPHVYGTETLADLKARCEARAAQNGQSIDFRQTNHEGELVDWVQCARSSASGMIVNAGALTHSSIVLLDAINAADVPCIEVHLSNIFRREPFRHQSYISLGAIGLICGFGSLSYELALDALAARQTV